MNPSAFTLLRLELAFSPTALRNELDKPYPKVIVHTSEKGTVYQCGFYASTISKDHVLLMARNGRATLANVPDSLKRIVWC